MLDVTRALDGITHTDHLNHRLNLNTKYKHLKQTTFNLLSPANEVWGKVMFLHMCVILFTEGWLPSMHHMSHDQGVCIRGRGSASRGSASSGVCIWGSAFRRICIQGGSASRWSASRGVCLQGREGSASGGGLGRLTSLPRGEVEQTPPRYMEYYGIRLTSGWYASYWNAFLLPRCGWLFLSSLNHLKKNLTRNDRTFPMMPMGTKIGK